MTIHEAILEIKYNYPLLNKINIRDRKTRHINDSKSLFFGFMCWYLHDGYGFTMREIGDHVTVTVESVRQMLARFHRRIYQNKFYFECVVDALSGYPESLEYLQKA